MPAACRKVLSTAVRRALMAASMACCALGTAQAGVVDSTVQSGRYLAASSQAYNAARMVPISSQIFGGMDLGQWENVTRQALLPSFGEHLGFRLEMNLSLLSEYDHLFLPGFVDTHYAAPDVNQFNLEFLGGRVPETPLVSDFSSQVLAYGSDSLSIERQLFVPGFSRAFGDGSQLDVAAVFAYQSYATPGLGAHDDYRLPGESTAGTGVRLGFRGELAPGVQIGAAYQSRIDMDAFQSYRGVYSEPGDFDIPASANIGVVVRATPRASLSFDVERVLYSEVNSFTSSILPDRFLSLLGDSASPNFDWDDLTVYRLGWNFQSSEEFSWQVQYSTSQQPAPTSEALARALAPEFADRNMSVGFSKRTGRNARLNFEASYAPSEYLLGTSAFGRRTDLADDQFEFEVIWIWDF